MTNTALLERIIDEKGLKRGYIAKKLNISYPWLAKKIRNEVDFKAVEIQILTNVLDIKDTKLRDQIFFA